MLSFNFNLGNKGLNSSTHALSKKTPPKEASKDQNSTESSLEKDHINVESNKINNIKGVSKYTPKDIDDCLKNLDDDPFALLGFMSRDVSMSSKQSETSVQQSSTTETLASALDELRKLAFSQSMLENIGKVEYR